MDMTPLKIQLSYTHYVICRNAEDLSREESLLARPTGASHANWVVGHILSTRQKTLALLGRERTCDQAVEDLYERGTEPPTEADATPLDELLAGVTAAQEGILAGLDAATPGMLSAAAPFSPGNRDDETVGSLLATLVFHEAYHSGQLGILRRAAGKEGIIK